MPDAQYTVQVPTVDDIGNPLVSVATYAHRWLAQTHRDQGSWIEPGKLQGDGSSHDHLTMVAEDTPLTDSTIKQLAAYVGEICNQAAVLAIKQGKQGPVRWHIRNPEYRPGQPAEAAVLAA